MNEEDFLKILIKENLERQILYKGLKLDIRVSKIPDTLYHLTTCDKLKKVLDKGLTPRTSTEYFTFENRIYLTSNKEKLIKFAKKKSIIANKDCFVILKVSLNGYSDRIRFFNDPNFNEAIYTLENIPKYTIDPIEKIIFKDNNVSIIPY